MTVRPGKKFGFQSAVENLQRWRRPDRLRQTVPARHDTKRQRPVKKRCQKRCNQASAD